MTEFSLLVGTADGNLPEWIRLLPLGEVKLGDGRESFTVDAACLDQVVAAFTSRGIDMVIDYEHQSLGVDRAPAAGWIKELEARPDGLWGRADWTAAASEYLKNREYRYFSPVLRLDAETRKPLALLHLGLTNVPAINHLPPLVAKAKAGGGSQAETPVPLGTPAPLEQISQEDRQKQEEVIMKSELMKLLGITVEQSDDKILALADTRLKQAQALPEIALALGLKPEATVSEIKGTVLALKQGSDQFSNLKTEVAALKAENARTKAAAVVDEALKAGKLTPAQQDWAMVYAGRDLEGFRVFADKAPQIVPVGESLKTPSDNAPGGAGLTPDELAVCKQLNLAPEAFKAQRQVKQEG